MRYLALALLAVMAALIARPGACLAQTPPDKWPQVKPLDKWPQVKPADQWQVPGEIQTPGDIQVPGDIQGVKVQKDKCEQRLVLAADTLFDFDKDMLTPQAIAALEKLGPSIKQAAIWGARIEGHTDAKGTDDYNQKLSERRAAAVKAWLAGKNYLPPGASVVGHGEKKPVAPNENADGSDNPDGRQLNRRVELVFVTCK